MQEKREGGVRGWWQLLIWLQHSTHLQHPVPGGGDWGRVWGAGQHAALHELCPHRDGGDGLLHGSVAQISYWESYDECLICSEKCPDCGRIPPGRRKKPKERFKRFRKLSTRKNGQKLRQQQQQVSDVFSRNIQNTFKSSYQQKFFLLIIKFCTWNVSKKIFNKSFEDQQWVEGRRKYCF